MRRKLPVFYPGLMLIAAGIDKRRVERLAYAYRVDRSISMRLARLMVYLLIRLGSRVPLGPVVAAWSVRRLPSIHASVRRFYRGSMRSRPVALIGPAERRVRRRLELLRRAEGQG
jgi:hypothetical protein